MTCRELRLVSPVVAVFSIARLVTLSLAVYGGERLHNGIVLPDQWPPRLGEVTYAQLMVGRDLKYGGPGAVPYLERPPEVIPIDVGRQLFVDDFLIANTNLRRTYHRATYHPASPVLQPDRPWELRGEAPRALTFSDGVWHDPADGLFKMWYYLSLERQNATGYATSRDGIHWEKPALDVVEPGTNIVQKPRDASTVWLDLFEQNPNRRFKSFPMQYHKEGEYPGHTQHMGVAFSPDGIHWSDVAHPSVTMRDRSTVFYNPFRSVWTYSIKVRPVIRTTDHPGREYLPLTRSRAYREARDVTAPWREKEIVPWIGADSLDTSRNDGIDKQTLGGQHLYNLDAVAYESIMLGMFSIFHGDGTGEASRHHMNDLTLGYSRDGFHWHRPDRRAFVGVGEKRPDWNGTNVQSAGGCCLVMGDQLWFYVSGRRPRDVCSMGLATLRRDGFASMHAGDEEGVLITRPLVFSGKHLFVNADCGQGELRVEVLRENVMDSIDRTIPVIEPFSRGDCIPVRTDGTLQQVQWKGAEDLSSLSDQPVRFCFFLRRGRLYSFWISPNQSGASHGYVAAGGPSFTGPRDTVGNRALTGQ